MSLVSLFFQWFMRPGQRHKVIVQGRKRQYYLQLPVKCDPHAPMPVVLALHGATNNAAMMAWLSRLSDKAFQEGFAVVYPEGTGTLGAHYWNGGFGKNPAEIEQVDDVAFVRSILDDLNNTIRVDSKRVFATGLSNGAVMAYRLAAELADRIAAVAPVAGIMPRIDCRPSRAVPLIHFHGTEDKFVPYQGGRGSRSVTGTSYPSVEETIQTWVKVNHCQETPTTEEIPDKAGDGTSGIVKTYSAGVDGAEVVLVTVVGGGHIWPGHKVPSSLGRSTHNIQANDMIWRFFQKHTMP